MKYIKNYHLQLSVGELSDGTFAASISSGEDTSTSAVGVDEMSAITGAFHGLYSCIQSGCKLDTYETFVSELLSEVMEYDAIYRVLVEKLGAPPVDRWGFILAHATRKAKCREWRFQGSLGFGGKFRSETCSVDCYPEDLTPERRRLIDEANRALTIFVK